MLSNAYLLAKVRFDTAENEPNSKIFKNTNLLSVLIILQNSGDWGRVRCGPRCRDRGRRRWERRRIRRRNRGGRNGRHEGRRRWRWRWRRWRWRWRHGRLLRICFLRVRNGNRNRSAPVHYVTAMFANVAKFCRTRSRLYRSQLLQVNIRLKVVDEIYKIYIFLNRSDLNISATCVEMFCYFKYACSKEEYI